MLLEHGTKVMGSMVENISLNEIKCVGCVGCVDVLDRSVMSLYEGARTRIRENSELSDEFEVKLEMHQVSVVVFSFFAVVVDYL